MKSFENAQHEAVKPKDIIAHEAIEFESTAIRSLHSIQNELITIRKYAEMIDGTSTKTFISSFLSNFNTIRSCNEKVLYFSDLISKLKEAPVLPEGEKDFDKTVPKDHPAETKKRDGANVNSNYTDSRQKIKADILETTVQIEASAETAASAIKYITKNNTESEIDDVVEKIGILSAAIAKLDDIEKDINECSGK